MGPAVYVIAILGCGEAPQPCDEVRMAETRYESRASCTAATEAVLMRAADVDYPVVVAQCRLAGAPDEPLRGDQVDLPEPEPTPHFRRAGRVQMAGRGR